MIVREGQVAVFSGTALDAFGPGRHTISTANIPLLVNLVQTVPSGDTPLPQRCISSTRDFMDMPAPRSRSRSVTVSRWCVRAHGTYSMAVDDAQLFVGQMVGARGYHTEMCPTTFEHDHQPVDGLLHNMSPILDLPAMFEKCRGSADQAARRFRAIGMSLKQLYILSISPTEETSAAIDEAASMGAIGDMDRYMKFKTARAVGDAATAEGGVAGGTAQMGLGLGAGMAAAQAMASSFASGQQAPAQPAAGGVPQPLQILSRSPLKTLLDNGLISQEEYEIKRQEILKRLECSAV